MNIVKTLTIAAALTMSGSYRNCTRHDSKEQCHPKERRHDA